MGLRLDNKYNNGEEIYVKYHERKFKLLNCILSPNKEAHFIVRTVYYSNDGISYCLEHKERPGHFIHLKEEHIDGKHKVR